MPPRRSKQPKFEFDNNPFAAAFCELNEQRLSGMFCDVELVAGTGKQKAEITAHKNVLAASSPYFKAMFSNRFEENKKHKVEVKSMTEKALTTIIEYMYVDASSVQSLMHAASMLLMDDLKEACGKYLSSSVSDFTCVDLLSIGSRYNCQEMINVASKHIKRNFKRISSSGALREVDREMVSLLLMADDLTGGEKAVYEFLVDWVRADPETRADELPSLLPLIRFPQLGGAFVADKVAGEPLISGNPRCSEIYINALKYFAAASDSSDAAGRYGSASWDRARNVFPFQVSTRQWTHPTTPLSNRKSHGAAVIDGLIFSIGGYGGVVGQRQAPGDERNFDTLCSCEVWNTYSGQPTWIASLPQPRDFLGVCASTERVYAVGGMTFDLDGSDSPRTVYIYDPLRDEWTNGPDTIHAGCDDVAMMDQCVYAVSEMWDTRTRGWQAIASPHQRARGVCRLAVVGDQMFVPCGNGSADVKMEVYDRRADAWRETDTPSLSVEGAGVTVSEGRIVVAGGVLPLTWDFVQSVKVLDGGEWKEVECEGFGTRCYNRLCTVDGVVFSMGGYNARSRTGGDIVCLAVGV